GFVRTGQAQLLQADEAAGSRLGKAFRRVSPAHAASAASSDCTGKVWNTRTLPDDTARQFIFQEQAGARAFRRNRCTFISATRIASFICVWVRAWQCRTRRRLADSEPRLANNFERARCVSSGTRGK